MFAFGARLKRLKLVLRGSNKKFHSGISTRVQNVRDQVTRVRVHS